MRLTKGYFYYATEETDKKKYYNSLGLVLTGKEFLGYSNKNLGLILHKCEKGLRWKITHKKSGLLLASFRKRSTARSFLVDISNEMDFNFSYNEINEELKSKYIELKNKWLENNNL